MPGAQLSQTSWDFAPWYFPFGQTAITASVLSVHIFWIMVPVSAGVHPQQDNVPVASSGLHFPGILTAAVHPLDGVPAGHTLSGIQVDPPHAEHETAPAGLTLPEGQLLQMSAGELVAVP